MKGVEITRYTSGDSNVVGALQQFGVGYSLGDISDYAVITLNRIKKFLQTKFQIQSVTKKLVEGIIERTDSGEYVGEGVEIRNNTVCNMFLVHGKKFRDGVQRLLESGEIRRKKNETFDNNSSPI